MLSLTAMDAVTQPRIHSAVGPLLEQLLVTSSGERRIVSASIRFDPEDRLGGAYLLMLKDELRRLDDDPVLHDLDHASREELTRDLRRIYHWAEAAGPTWSAPALAVFSWEAGGLFEAIPLPGAVRTRVVVDRTPRVRDLVAAEPFTRPVVVVVLDRTHVRLFEADYQHAQELPGIFAAASGGGKFHPDRHDAPGWGERDFQGRREEEARRQHAEITPALEELVRSKQAVGIVLAGPRDRTAALAVDLPLEMTRLLLGEIPLNPTSVTPGQVKEATRHLLADAGHRLILDELRDFQAAMGEKRAVEGIRETLRAVSNGQVRMLLVGEDCRGAGFRCGPQGRLVLSPDECSEAGEPTPLLDVVDEAVEDALRMQASVMTLPEPDSRDLVDGIGAFCRYRVP